MARRGRFGSFLVYLIGSLVVAGAAFTGVRLWQDKDAQLVASREAMAEGLAKGPAVQVATIAQGPKERLITLLGDTRPYQVATLYGKVGGYLKSIAVDRGDRVKSGQVVAEVESAETDRQFDAAASDLENKKKNAERERDLVARFRARVPNGTFRTTFIAGHPGETDAAFQSLCDFVREAELDHVGVFNFSREEGTVAAMLPKRVPQKEVDARRRELLRIQPARSALSTAAADGHKALVFSQWTSLLDLIEPELLANGIGFVRLDGSTTDRAGVTARFQADDGPPVMLVSLKAGGTGLNLTAADHVFLLDPWWNPAVEDQASDRAHRIGQSRPVTIYRLVVADSIEERILDLHRHKRDLAADLLAGAETTARLSEDELIALIRQ